jgi:protein-disulfide isomerase
MKKNITTGAVGIGIALSLLVSCQGSGSFAKLQETLAGIEQKQDTILAKLDTIEQKIGQAPAGKPGAPGPKGPKPGAPDPKATYKVEVGDAHFKGGADAKVTIVEWSDFQCPYCGRVVPTIGEINKAYGDEVRIAFKHNALPMHNRARPAALAAEAAGKQGKFFEMHDLLFANAKELTDENFVKWAGDLGLDVEKFKKDLTDPAIGKKVDDNQKQGTTLGARGTPAFFVNGRYLSGAQPFDAFKAVIDEEMKKADAFLAKGISKDKLYAEVIKAGKTAP